MVVTLDVKDQCGVLLDWGEMEISLYCITLTKIQRKFFNVLVIVYYKTILLS